MSGLYNKYYYILQFIDVHNITDNTKKNYCHCDCTYDFMHGFYFYTAYLMNL